MRSHGYPPESWALRVPLASFTYLAPCLNDPYKADAFFPKLAKSLGSRYLLLRIENAENFGLHKNLIILEKLVNQPDGHKLLVEIGTLAHALMMLLAFFSNGATFKGLKCICSIPKRLPSIIVSYMTAMCRLIIENVAR